MPRAINKGTITFGLVSVPIKVYAANSPQNIRLNRLSPKGNRLKQQYIDSISGELVDTKVCKSKGYEYAKGKYVQFSEEELKSLEAGRDKAIQIREFVPAEEVDSLRVEKSFLLGSDGGERSYSLLAQVMENNWVVAIAQWKSRGRDHLVAIRPVRAGGMLGLAMQQLFYENEQRDLNDIGVSGCEVSDAELELAEQLVSGLTSTSLDWSKYSNKYVERLQHAVQQKIDGEDVAPIPQEPNTRIIDLYESLKISVDQQSAQEQKVG